MPSARHALILTPFLCAALAGCVDQPPYSTDSSGRPLENQFEDDLAFVDIPVPRNFQYDPTASHKIVYVDRGNVRAARLVYHGARHVKDVVKFYEEYMASPANGWKKVRDEIIQGKGERVLLFEKGQGDRFPEQCKVKILRERGRTTIVIEVPPL